MAARAVKSPETPGVTARRSNAYLEGDLDALRPKKAPGAKPKLTDKSAELLRGWVIAVPAGCGLDRANWTYQELAVYLYQRKGIEVGKSAQQVFCRKHGIRPYSPTDRFLNTELRTCTRRWT